MRTESRLSTVLAQGGDPLLEEWLRLLIAGTGARKALIVESKLREQCREFLAALTAIFSNSENAAHLEFRGAIGERARDVLTQVSRERGALGFTPSETALFVFSLKSPVLARLRAHSEKAVDSQVLFDDIVAFNDLLDRLGLFTTEIFQRSREEVILRQQQEMLELSTPVVKLWDGILALPLIGTLDSARTQVVMESLLQEIVATGSDIAILDITGVQTVDTLVAQHLMKTVQAARLMGAECIVSGIRPQIAQTIVHLGVDLGTITTKATLADAFRLALRHRGCAIGALPALATPV